MRIILLQDVEKLGKIGEVKNVSDGYGRNFLIPKGLAELAMGKNLKTHAQRLAAETRHREQKITSSQALAEKLSATRLRFNLKMGEKGQAFGSITAQDIADELAKNGIPVEKSWIELEQGIKTTGEHKVRIKLPHQIASEVNVVVGVTETTRSSVSH